jgi:hypothetical protein
MQLRGNHREGTEEQKAVSLKAKAIFENLIGCSAMTKSKSFFISFGCLLTFN